MKRLLTLTAVLACLASLVASTAAQAAARVAARRERAARLVRGLVARRGIGVLLHLLDLQIRIFLVPAVAEQQHAPSVGHHHQGIRGYAQVSSPSSIVSPDQRRAPGAVASPASRPA